MFNETIRNMLEARKFLTASPEETVTHVCKLMRAKKAGAVLVIMGGNLTGIFTERDVVFRVIAQDLNPEKTSLLKVMTPEPMALGPDNEHSTTTLGDSEVLSVKNPVCDPIPEFSQRPEHDSHIPSCVGRQ